MRRIFLGWFMALGMSLAFIGQQALAQEATGPGAAIETTIQNQMDAFLEDDVARAFGFAAPTIQRMFKSPENFGAMVRQGYPMVWRPRDVVFGALTERGSSLWQEVIVTDANGRTHILDYHMVETMGEWRIAAVMLRPDPGVAA